MPTPLSSAGLLFFSSLRFQVGFFISLLTGHTVLRSGRIRWFFARRIWYFLSNPDPDPTCNNRFIKLFSTINKFKHKMMVYNIEFYAYLPKILIYFFSSFRFQVGSVVRSDPRPKINRCNNQANVIVVYHVIIVEIGIIGLFGTIHGHLYGILAVPYLQTFSL